MGGRAPVSCYIRTLNEERCIGQVIAAVRDFVGEVIVIDSGSSDATVAMAQAEGARVVHQPWLGNGRQKRFGEDQCHYDFLLDLDADETVTPELGREIQALFAGEQPPRPVYELKIVTVPPFGKPWWNSAVAYRRKLYDRRIIRAPDHAAWDQFEVPAGVAVGRLSGAILHRSFRDVAHMAEKLNRVSTARAREGRTGPAIFVAARVLGALPIYFLKHLLVRRLFLAGVYGVAVAGLAAYGRWLRDVKRYEQILASRTSNRNSHDITPSTRQAAKKRP